VLAIVLGVAKGTVSKLVNDQRPVDASLALTLGDVFTVPAESFLELQKKFDLALARLKATPDPSRATRALLYGDLPVAEMIKRGWLGDVAIMDQAGVEQALAKFFGVNTADEIEILPHAAKKTAVFSPVTAAQMAWICRAKRMAEDMLVGRYSQGAVRAAVEKLKECRAVADEARHVPRIMTEAGIRFVIIESLPSAKIDGVCFWLNDFAPVIAISMRHDRIDNFWFVVRHELEHVIHRHGRGAVMVDADLDRPQEQDIADEERVANAAAAAFCVAPDSLAKFVARKAPFFAERDILGFARTLKVHPGLVAGQLRHTTGRFNLFQKYLVNVRSIVAPNAITDGWGDVAPVE